MSQQYYTDNQDYTIALTAGTREGTNMDYAVMGLPGSRNHN